MHFCKYCGTRLEDGVNCNCPESIRAANIKLQKVNLNKSEENSPQQPPQPDHVVQNHNFFTQQSENSQSNERFQQNVIPQPGNIAPQSGVPQQNNGYPQQGNQNSESWANNNESFHHPVAAQKKKFKPVIFIPILLLILIIGGLSWFFLSGGIGGGMEEPLKNLTESIQNGDFNTYLKAFPSKVAKEIKEDLDKDDFKDMKKDFESEYGKNYKVTYKIDSKEKLSKDDLEELEEEFLDDYGKAKFTKGYTLDVMLKIKGKLDDFENTTSIEVVYVKGEGWKLIDSFF